MKTDSKADVFIYLDESEGFTRSKTYVQANVKGEELKEYYNRIIQTRLAYENLEPEQKLLFYQYFFTRFSLGFLAQINGRKCTQSQQSQLKTTLASACCNFCKALGIDYNENMFLLTDTFNFSPEECPRNEAFEFVYTRVKEYNNFVNRAIVSTCT